MGNSYETSFVKDYQPGADAVVELTNARFADVINGCFFDQGVNVIIKDGKIAAMPGLEGESTEMEPDLTIDLKGKTVLPGLFNVHCHVQLVNPTLFSNLKIVRAVKKNHDQQVEKNMVDRGYLTPEFRGIKKILLGFMGLGTIDYEDENSGVIAFPLNTNEQQVRDAVDRAIDERGADLSNAPL